MSIHPLVHLVEHHSMIIQLTANLYRQIPLPAYTLTQAIQLLVLIPKYTLVIFVYLLVAQLRLIWG